MTKKKATQAQKVDQEKPSEPNMQDFLVLGHLVKYNLYMLAKSVVFSAVAGKTSGIDEAIKTTHRVMEELDLDTKRRSQE